MFDPTRGDCSSHLFFCRWLAAASESLNASVGVKRENVQWYKRRSGQGGGERGYEGEGNSLKCVV